MAAHLNRLEQRSWRILYVTKRILKISFSVTRSQCKLFKIGVI